MPNSTRRVPDNHPTTTDKTLTQQKMPGTVMEKDSLTLEPEEVNGGVPQ